MTVKVLRIAQEIEVTDYQMEEFRRNARDEIQVETMVVCLPPMTDSEFVAWFDKIVTDAGNVDIVSLETPDISIKLIGALLKSSNFLTWGGKLLRPIFEDGKFQSYVCFYCLI